MSIFIQATKSGWYNEFLNQVVDEILKSGQSRKFLDIGTGPGTLPNLLISRDSSLNIIGIDIDSTMIDDAREKAKSSKIVFDYQGFNTPLKYQDGQFDVVTFCSVLFLLDDSTKKQLTEEALRVLKPGGRIIVLTPSGKKSIITSFIEVWRYPYSKYNFTFIIWKAFTTYGARKWVSKKWASKFAINKGLKYESNLVFNQNARIETIFKY